MPTSIAPIQTRSLKLDDQNPRLPGELHGRSQSELLAYIYKTGALEELAQSFIDNGFFEHEPLIVLAEPDEDGRHIVLEGNRRLATLMILLELPEAEELSFLGLSYPMSIEHASVRPRASRSQAETTCTASSGSDTSAVSRCGGQRLRRATSSGKFAGPRNETRRIRSVR